MLRVVLDGILLPLRLYFQLRTVRNEWNNLIPELTPNYTLAEIVGNLDKPNVRRGIFQLGIVCIIATIWIPILVTIVFWLLPHAPGTQPHITGSVILFGIIIAIRYGWYQSTFLAITISACCGMFILIPSLSAIVMDSIRYTGGRSMNLVNLANILSFPVGGGIVLAWIIGAGDNIKFGLLCGTAIGLVFCLAFIAAGSFNIGVIVCLVFILVITHLWIYPLQLLISFVGWTLIPSKPTLSKFFWKISPLRWDEFTFLPLIGGIELLIALYMTDQEMGKAAVQKLSRHRFQSHLSGVIIMMD